MILFGKRWCIVLLTLEKMNFPLYFPEETSDNRQSLFTTILDYLKEIKLNVIHTKTMLNFY